MKITEMKKFDIEQLKALYNSVGWVSYTKDIWKFTTMFNHSLSVIAAYEEEKLIGIIRTIGDYVHILYIQDIIVHPNYQRKGVATALMDDILARFDVRQMVLITDLNDEASNGFYQSYGFKKSEDMKIQCYVKFNH